MSFKTGIVGAAGYTGGELLRLLLRHPATSVVFAQSRSQAGKPVSSIHTDLLGETDLHFSAETPLNEVDVVFLCLAHGEAGKWLETQTLPPNLKVIDLSHDHRADPGFVYGLPEKNREFIRNATRLANPGCFATALQLA
jgi:N-acetyl-gamma-glutamyl-phosphate reductase